MNKKYEIPKNYIDKIRNSIYNNITSSNLRINKPYAEHKMFYKNKNHKSYTQKLQKQECMFNKSIIEQMFAYVKH